MPDVRSAGSWAAAGPVMALLVSHVDALRHVRRGHPAVLYRSAGVAARPVANAGHTGWAIWVAPAAG